MDTIIYLKMDKRQRMQELPVFHMNQLREEQLKDNQVARRERDVSDASLIPEGIQLLYVTIPWDIEKRYAYWFRELPGWLTPFFQYSASIETVCDFSVERWLKEKGMKADWEKIWPYDIYREYHRPEYAKALLVKGMEQFAHKQVHCYVLGYENYMPQILMPFIRRIRTLTFCIAGEQPAQLTDYLEELAWEEGLAATVRQLEDKAGYRRLRLECATPALVLDFTGEEKVAPAGAFQSLVWIDMDSIEVKKHKILIKSRETTYFSMKEEWGRLDTVSKNGYNTIVN